MIQSYINTPTTLTSNNDSIKFQTDCIRTNSCQGCNSWLCHNAGSGNYEITKGGIYEINFNASISSSTVGIVAIGLFNNGELIPGTLMAETIAAADDYANIGINKRIRVCCNGDSTISVKAVSVVSTPSTPSTPITTQVPIIVSANFNIDKTSC